MGAWNWFANNIGWILAFIGGFGTIGIIVAIVFFGVPLLLIINSVAGFFRAVFEFLKTPPGMAIAVLALCGLFYFLGMVHQTRLDTVYWEGQKKLAEEQRKQRDAQIKAEVSADADKRVAEIEKDQEDLQKQVASYEKLISNNPGCFVTDDDIKRLRGNGRR